MTRVRRYETMFILKTTIEPEICAKQIETIKENIITNGGEIEAVEDIGSKPLAYEIQKNKRGYYFVIYFKAPTSSIKELERLNNINENILRFIFIKFDTNKEIKNWDNMVAMTKVKKPKPSQDEPIEQVSSENAPATQEQANKPAQEPTALVENNEAPTQEAVAPSTQETTVVPSTQEEKDKKSETSNKDEEI